MKTIPAPDVDLHRPTVKALVDLTERLDIMNINHPELLRQALQMATLRFNLRRNDVCFRGEKDEKDARTFLKMMDIAGLVPERSRLTVRRVDPADTKLPHWFRAVRARALAVKRLPSPGTSSSQAKSYARWVGVQLCSPNGEAEGQAWRIGLFLASIAYSGAGKAI